MFKKIITAPATLWVASRSLWPVYIVCNSLGWDKLKQIQDYKIVQSMYLWLFIVPVSAKVLSRMEPLANLTIFNHKFEVVLELPFSWQAFFYAALCFVVGNAIYRVAAPALVQEHSDYQNFIGTGKSNKQLSEYVSKYIDDEPFSEITRGASTNFNNVTSEELRPMYWDIYFHLCYVNKIVRFACSAIYGLGFLFLADVAYKNIMWVIHSTDFYSFQNKIFFGDFLSSIIKYFVN